MKLNILIFLSLTCWFRANWCTLQDIIGGNATFQSKPLFHERVAEWLRCLTRKPKVRTAVGSNPTLDSLVAVRNTSPGQPEPCEGNLVAVAGSCGGLMVKHPWPLLEISLSDFRGLATLNINTYLPTYLFTLFYKKFFVLANSGVIAPHHPPSVHHWFRHISCVLL